MNIQKGPWTVGEIAFLILIVALCVLVVFVLVAPVPQAGQPEQDITGYIVSLIFLLIIGMGGYIIRKQRRVRRGRNSHGPRK